jgi:hypothetical protein
LQTPKKDKQASKMQMPEGIQYCREYSMPAKDAKPPQIAIEQAG